MNKILTVLIFPIVLLSSVPAVSSPPQIRLMAPAEESFLGTEGMLIIGQVEDGRTSGLVEVLDNGKTLGSANVLNGIFTYRVKLPEGRHEIAFSIPGVETKILKVFVGRQEGYRYHIKTEGESCGDCHNEASHHRYSVSSVQEDMCSQCHDTMGTGEYVHGPVAAGSCTPCHDPHGSRYPKFLVATGRELCLVCHSQSLSKKHTEERQNAQCVKCHDPHSSEKNYYLS